ncbi:hypothetical protein [Glutamicibacter uratoxydans]|uniref:hypothetical protein n=1 Tax=Glutamicibacter uratoxydans TaxID=43667 RepID=UPI003D6E27FE
MKPLQAQDYANSLIGPLIVAGLCSGTVLGMASAMLFFLPELLWFPEEDVLGSLASFLEMTLLILGVSGLLGFLASLAPVAGALLALKLAFNRASFPSRARQLLATGLGGLAGGLVSAFGLQMFLFAGDVRMPNLVFAGAVVLVSGIGGLVILHCILRRRERKTGSQPPAYT